MLINQSHILSFPIGGKNFQVITFSNDLNPKIYSVEHKTHYKYQSPVTQSNHFFRLQPVHDLYQSILSYELISSSQGEPCNFIDIFGNHVYGLAIKEPYDGLVLNNKFIVAVSERPYKKEDASYQPYTMPMIWKPWDRVTMQHYLQIQDLSEIEFRELSNFAMSFVKTNNFDVFEILNDINQTISRDFFYVSGSTTLFTTPYEVFVNRKGVCQDFTNLFITLARLLDIPARYRMGYVYTGGDYKNQIRSEASHAWVEVYLPYIGWVGFDPTNGCLAGKNYIRIACGRYYYDATPTTGTIVEGGGAESLSVSVKVVQLNIPE